MKTENPVRSFQHVPAKGIRNIRTLLADDSPSMLVFLSRLLGKDPRTLIVGLATDALHAVQSASETTVDLVLLDFHMPGLDSAETTWRLKQLPRLPRVLLVTAEDIPEARARAQWAGADALLLKAPDLESQLQTTLDALFNDTPVPERCPTR